MGIEMFSFVLSMIRLFLVLQIVLLSITILCDPPTDVTGAIVHCIRMSISISVISGYYVSLPICNEW